VVLGYWAEPEKTAEAVDPDGWTHTGDLALMDAEGYLSITGRIKDVVIRGGENVYPCEIEEFPMTVTGKVRKVEMREVATALLAGGGDAGR